MIKKIFFFASLLLLLGLNLNFSPKPAKAPKYIFLLIGDGMGINQLYLANEYAKETKQTGLAIMQFPNFALTTTFPADTGKITDSAAGGTAIASGHKTKNGAIGMNPWTGEKYSSMAEILQSNGYKIGIISSVGINHATPAAFYGHRASRSMYNDLVDDMCASNFEYFASGGLISSARKEIDADRQNLVKKIENAGYTLICKPENTSLLKTGDKIFVCDTSVKGTDDALPNTIDPIKKTFELSEMLKMGIDKLMNNKGFFIMAEGGKIDWSCHNNDAASVIYEVFDFDKTVKVAMDFYAKHPDETLIIVTADHETGGMSWGGNATKYSTYFSKLSQQKYSMDLIADSLAVLPVAEQMKFAQRATGLSLEAEFFTNKNAQNKAHFMVDSLDRAAGIGWTSGAHTGIPVGTYALGVGAEKYNGRIDNTDIIKFVFQLLAINFK